LTGCYSKKVPDSCLDDACTIATCQDDGSCKYVEKDCNKILAANVSFCHRPYCVPFQGTCELVNYDCSKDNKTRRVDNNSCETVECDDKQRKCVINDNDCFALVALVVGLSAGAIGGIAAAAFIAAALVSGGAAGAAMAQKNGEGSVTHTNKLFEDSGMSGASAVHG